MISILQFDVADEAAFVDQARAALAALAARPGYLSGRVGRSTDEPTRWALVTEWANVGSYRRGLGAYDVKLRATPLLAQAVDLPSAFEELLSADPGSEPTSSGSDRA